MTTLHPARIPPAPVAAAPAPAASARFAPPTPARPLKVEEPPPWVTDAGPDDDETGLAPDSGAGAPEVELEAAPPTAPAAPRREPPQSRAASPSPAAAGLPPLTPTALGDDWAVLIRPLAAAGSVGALVRELALQAELRAVAPAPAGGRCWTLIVERDTLRAPPLVAKLTSALQEALGEPVQLDVQAGQPQDSIARRDALARELAQREAEATIQSDPGVLALMAQFRTARIVPGSIKPLAAPVASPRPNRTSAP